MYTVPLGVPSLLRGRSTLILEVWPGGTARWNNGRSVHGGGEGGGGRRQHQRAKQMQMKQMDSLGDRRKSTVSLTRSAHPRTNPCYTKHLSLSLSLLLGYDLMPSLPFIRFPVPQRETVARALASPSIFLIYALYTNLCTIQSLLIPRNNGRAISRENFQFLLDKNPVPG